jgi:hypothetical protein
LTKFSLLNQTKRSAICDSAPSVLDDLPPEMKINDERTVTELNDEILMTENTVCTSTYIESFINTILNAIIFYRFWFLRQFTSWMKWMQNR